MKIFLTRILAMFSRHIDNANYESALGRYDEHGSLGPYSILCSLGTKDRH